MEEAHSGDMDKNGESEMSHAAPSTSAGEKRGDLEVVSEKLKETAGTLA
jgi:hypothetical protein